MPSPSSSPSWSPVLTTLCQLIEKDDADINTEIGSGHRQCCRRLDYQHLAVGGGRRSRIRINDQDQVSAPVNVAAVLIMSMVLSIGQEASRLNFDQWSKLVFTFNILETCPENGVASFAWFDLSPSFIFHPSKFLFTHFLIKVMERLWTWSTLVRYWQSAARHSSVYIPYVSILLVEECFNLEPKVFPICEQISTGCGLSSSKAHIFCLTILKV